MLLDKLLKFKKVFSMHSLQIASVDVLAILSEMGTHAVSLDIRFGGGIVFLKTGRIIAHEIDPGAPALPSGPNQRAVMASGRETHLNNCVR